jgi:hypothetical protein
MATPTTYGSRDSNPFQVPKEYLINGVKTPSNNQNARYYLLVDSVTGDTTVKTADGKLPSSAGGNTGMDRIVGTIPKDGVFKPVVGSTTSNETKYFTSAQGQKDVKNHAVITAQKAGAQNAQQLIFPNSATAGAGQGQNQPPQNGGDQQAGADENAAVVAELKKESKEGTRKDYGNVQYPVDLNPAVQDCIKFSIFEYKAPGVQPGTSAAGSRIVSLVGGNPGFKDRKNILGTITLPIPGGINDSNSADWSSGQIDEFTRALANISGQTILGGGQQGADAGGDEFKNLTPGGGKDLKSIIVSKFAGEASGASNLISRQFGAVVNPNLELLFNGPSLRTFGFNFRMSPRDAPEARNIRKIIRFFKQAMSVKRSNSSLLLKAPHTFAISYVTSNKQHPYLNKFKECALTVCNVNYTPDGTYMTYKGDIDDRSMTAYELSLTFQEIEPLFDDEYGNEKEITSIGF